MADFRKTAGKVAGFAAGKAKTFALFAAKKTKDVSHIAKLNVDIASERDCIKRNYLEIGKLYYETHREDPESYFMQLCQEIDLSLESIARMESEIARLKTESASGQPDIEVEILDEDELTSPDPETVTEEADAADE